MEKLNKNQLTNLFNKGAKELNYGNPLKAIECYNSEEYQKAKSYLNDNNSERIIHIVDGVN